MRNRVRIIGGEWRSRILTFPNDMDLRPTPDRVRETVFNWLGQDMSHKRCLDLFAGSGVMGFEAASRGAAEVVMVESSPVVLKALRATARKLGATRIELAGADAMNFIDSDRRRFDVIFLDPPYRLDFLPRLLPKLHAHLADGGVVYLENDCPAEFEGWAVRRRGHAGKVCYHLLSSTINKLNG